MPAMPTFRLQGAAKDGVEMPVVASGCAFGNWTDQAQGIGFSPEDANRAITLALDCGVRTFDGAHFYRTEPIVGRILGERFAKGELQREDVWIQTKVAHPIVEGHTRFNPYRALDWVGLKGADERSVRDALLQQFWKSLDELGVGWVDVVLIHWPSPHPKPEGPPLTSAEARRMRKIMYRALLDMMAGGATRAVGVSNFSSEHLKQLGEDLPGVPMPAINQLEISPYNFNRNELAAMRDMKVVPQAWSPFASGEFGLLKDPVLVGLAAKYAVTVGQIICHWLWTHGVASVPKSSGEKRLRASLDINSFSLTTDELTSIDKLSEGKEPRRTNLDPCSFT
ncbi:Aldose reductase C [Diplonema papillatum]|nr:Aldose reductase C [Diplonema papillatum]